MPRRNPRCAPLRATPRRRWGGDLTLNGAKVNLGSGDIAASAVTSILIQGYAGDDTIDLSAVTGMYALAA